MNNIVLRAYETTKILKKVIKEKITDIPVYIFNDKNFTISNIKIIIFYLLKLKV